MTSANAGVARAINPTAVVARTVARRRAMSGSLFVGMGIREQLVLPLAREALNVRETPTGGLLFPGGEEIFSARAQYEHDAHHLPAHAESAARLLPRSRAARAGGIGRRERDDKVAIDLPP